MARTSLIAVTVLLVVAAAVGLGGAAGPLDLMPPKVSRRDPPRRAALSEMLDPANRSACCD